MDIYKAIYSRRSMRDFEEREIDIDTIKKILDAGLQAPSNSHMREWEFIIINDKSTRLTVIDKIHRDATKKEIENILDEWKAFDPIQRESYFDAIPKQYKMLLTAGCLIIPCFRQPYPLLKPTEISSLNYFASIWCCIENILLAAVAEGIFGVTRIPLGEESQHIKALLTIPEDYEVPCYLALGYPDKSAKQVKQNMIKVEERIHFNKWFQ